MSHMILTVVVVASIWIAFAPGVVQKNPRIRKYMTSHPLWKLQFALHPLIVAVGAYLISTWDSTDVSTSSSRINIPMLCLSPFVFNFGVEPWDIPADWLFRLLFYFHHVAPLMTIITSASMLKDYGFHDDKKYYSSFCWIQALLFGHMWMLHTFFTLDRFQIVSKQKLFWPYMMQGMILWILYWSSLFDIVMLRSSSVSLDVKLSTTDYGSSTRMAIQEDERKAIAIALLELATPMMLQVMGRWGLYLRLLQLLGFPNIGDAHYDLFELRKQPIEFASMIVSGVSVGLWRYRHSFL